MADPIRIPERLARGTEQIAGHVDFGNGSQTHGDSPRRDLVSQTRKKVAADTRRRQAPSVSATIRSEPSKRCTVYGDQCCLK